MAWERFGEKRAARIEKLLKDLLTNGNGDKGTRLVIYNDNAYKYPDLGGWSPAVLREKLTALYDAAAKDSRQG